MAQPKFREFTEDELYAVPAETDAKPSAPKMNVVPETKQIQQVNLACAPFLNTPERVVGSNGKKSLFQENKLIILILAAVVIGWIGYSVYKANEERKKTKNDKGHS